MDIEVESSSCGPTGQEESAPSAPEEEPCYDGTDLLSWRLQDVTDVVVPEHEWDEEGCGCSKAQWNMMVQLCLAAYYVVSWILLLRDSHEYYVWQDGEEKETLTIRTDETFFQCDDDGDKVYYLECDGPKHSNNTISPVEEGESASCESASLDEETWSFLFLCIITIAVYVLFCMIELQSGRYNKLRGLVTFERDKKTGLPRPVKYGTAFTLFCNFSKGAVTALGQSELCGGRFVVMGSREEYTSMVQIVCSAILLLAYVIFIMVFVFGILMCLADDTDESVDMITILVIRILVGSAAAASFVLR